MQIQANETAVRREINQRHGFTTQETDRILNYLREHRLLEVHGGAATIPDATTPEAANVQGLLQTAATGEAPALNQFRIKDYLKHVLGLAGRS